MRWLAVLCLLIACGAGQAQAHTKSETQSAWRIVGSTVHLTFTIPDIEAKRLSGDGSVPSDDALGKYLTGREDVLDHDKSCKSARPVQPLSASAGFHRFEFTFLCPDAEAIAFRSSAFFDLVPTHVTYAQIVPESGEYVEQLFTKDRQTLELVSASGKSPLQDASFFEYVGMGIMHIFTGYDHQAFLLALVLLSTQWRSLAFVITGFTIGHSISLTLSVLGVIRPHTGFIDLLVGLTIALIAAENIAENAQRRGTIALAFGGILLVFAVASFSGLKGLPGALIVGAMIFAMNYMMLAAHIKDAARLRLVVTLIFGTIHGFSFAGNLLEMKLPAGRLAELLVGFNLGVEIGQLAVVGALLVGLAILIRLKLTLPRPIVVDVLSSVLVGLGLFWFVSRGYGT